MKNFLLFCGALSCLGLSSCGALGSLLSLPSGLMEVAGRSVGLVNHDESQGQLTGDVDSEPVYD